PYGLPSTWSSIHFSSCSIDSGECVVAPSTPKPPARLTAATTSRQWLKASSGNSTPSMSQIGDFMIVSTPCRSRLIRPALLNGEGRSDATASGGREPSRFRCSDLACRRRTVSARAMADMQGAVLALALLRRPVECWARDQAQDPRERELMSALQSGRSTAAGNETYDVVVVGAGFAGMYMLHRLRGLGVSVRVYEQGDGVGGTWYWNRYPGARCDVESMQYSYSFSDELQQEWNWSERYAPQPEILQYARHVAERFNLRPHIQLNTRVEGAVFDEGTESWRVTTSDGKIVVAKFVVLATGCLSNARVPDIRGLPDFRGSVYHTGHWPHEAVDFTGLRVGVIGTGSSAIQSIPVIARQARELFVFQRTPNFSIPARNAELTAQQRDASRKIYPEVR